MSIKTDISPGEFIDKLTILEIKKERIIDPEKLANVTRELETLQKIWSESTYSSADISTEMDSLRHINGDLWEIEDRIREKEAATEFDQEFIQLARSVYITNDKRAGVKRQINNLLGSSLVEEKSYKDYKQHSIKAPRETTDKP